MFSVVSCCQSQPWPVDSKCTVMKNINKKDAVKKNYHDAGAEGFWFLYANMVLIIHTFSFFSVWKRRCVPTWTVNKWRCLLMWRTSFLKICWCLRLWRPGNVPSQPNRTGWWRDERDDFRFRLIADYTYSKRMRLDLTFFLLFVCVFIDFSEMIMYERLTEWPSDS